MSAVAACKTATTQNAGTEHDAEAENAKDYIAPGVLAVHRSVGAVDSGLRRTPYSFTVSASYSLTGDQVMFKKLSLTGRPIQQRGLGQLVVSLASDLAGKLDTSKCFRIKGTANCLAGSDQFFRGQLFVDGCVVSDRIPTLRGVLFSPAKDRSVSLKVSFT